MTTRTVLAAAGTLLLATIHAAAGEKQYGPGVTDTEVKIGQTMPYSGPASAYGTQGRIEDAYYAMINSKGGINGRKITMLSLDDAYSPPKTVEQTRRLVEQDEVLGPRKALEDAGAKVDIVSPERGEFLERLAVECRNVIRPKAGTAAEARASWPPRTTCSATIPFAPA